MKTENILSRLKIIAIYPLVGGLFGDMILKYQNWRMVFASDRSSLSGSYSGLVKYLVIVSWKWKIIYLFVYFIHLFIYWEMLVWSLFGVQCQNWLQKELQKEERIIICICTLKLDYILKCFCVFCNCSFFLNHHQVRKTNWTKRTMYQLNAFGQALYCPFE